MSLLAELKRRKVFRVAAAYVAGAFIVIQAADVVFPRIPLPDWTVSLVVWLAILGFPIALVLAWAFDVTPEGVRRTEAESSDPVAAVEQAGAPAASRAGWRLRAAIAGVVAVVVFAAAALTLGDRARDAGDAAPPVSAHVLAILPFEIRGSGDLAYLADGMVDLLAAKLSGADRLRAVDPRALLDYVRRNAGATAHGTAEAAARHFGAGYFVLGSVVEFGGRIQLRAALYARDRPGEAVVEASAEGGDDALFAIVDALAAQLLAGLSEGAPGRLARLAALTTDSVAALKHYLAGERAYREARFAEAADDFDRAVRIDSAFALAAYRLATAAMWTSDHDRVAAATALARRHEAALAPRERALLEAFDAAKFEHQHRDYGRAERLYRQIVARYPDEVDAWYFFGELVYHEGRYLGYTWAEAAEPFARALALAPEHSTALYHSANLALAAAPRDTAALLALSARLLQASGDSLFSLVDVAYARQDRALQRRLEALLTAEEEPINAYYANVAVNYAVESDRAAARRVWDVIARTTLSEPVKALAHANLARVEQAWGHLDDAERDLRETTRLNEHLGWQERLRLALHPLRPAPPSVLRALRDSVAAWTSSPPETLPDNLFRLRFGHAGVAVRTYLIGALDVRIDPESARRAAAALSGHTGAEPEAVVARDLGTLLYADLDRAAGDAASALRRLEAARFWTANTVDLLLGTLAFHRQVFLRAELLHETGRTDDAARWYRIAADHVFEYRAPALYRLCQLHEAAGRKTEAAEACRRFVDLWRDADPALQGSVADARRTLTRLPSDRDAASDR